MSTAAGAYMIPDPTDDTTWIIGSAAEPAFGVQTGAATLVNVHPVDQCAGRACVVHNPSDHHMRGWPLNWRGDRGLMERMCPHRVGHPDPDSVAWLLANGDEHAGAHGCDRCCVPEEPRDA